MSEADGERRISLIWPDVEQLPVLRANQFVAQVGMGPGGPEECLLAIGYVAPPMILGTPEEQNAMLGAMGAVAVKAIARISMSPERLDELIGLLAQHSARMKGEGEVEIK